MKEVYKHEFTGWQKILQRFLGMWRINQDSIDFKWGYFAPEFGFKFIFNRGGYFDSNMGVTICFIWGIFSIKLPFKTKLSEGCSMPRYGVEIHNDTLWIHLGGKYDESIGQTDSKWITFEFPFVSLKHDEIFHTVQTPDGAWEKADSWEANNAKKVQIPFVYTLRDGTRQHRVATCHKERRRWHRKWFRFLPAAITQYKLCIQYNDEVGERSGSWKGGVMGTSAILDYPDEPMEVAFERHLKSKVYN